MASGHILRFVQVNDVYELDELTRFGTALKTARQEAADNVTCIGVLVGDFLAPSILSSLDRGRGMIDVLNGCGVDIVCFGNHETDVPHSALLERIRESNFVWINSNMPDLPLPGKEERSKVVEYLVMHVGGHKVGFLGLLTEDPSLYRPDSFAGAEILPVAREARRLRTVLMEQEGCDLVIPLTHQSVTRDRELASEGLFPLILGGHDHDPYSETINGSTFIKVGCDAKLVGFVDVAWEAPGTAPTISYRMEPITQWEKDPEIQARVEVHKQVLRDVEKAVLCRCPKGVVLTSKGARRQQVTVGTMLVTSARKALQVDCTIVNAGNIRGNTLYPLDKEVFTYADLKAEVPFPCEMVVLPKVPGSVIAASIEYSRQWATADPPQEKGGYLQVDDNITVDPETHKVLELAGRPLDPDGPYTLATTYDICSGIDNLRPLLDYKQAHPDMFPKNRDDGWGLKELLVDYYARAIWWEIVRDQGFASLDEDGSGDIDREELTHAIRKYFDGEVGKLLVENLMSAADANGDGVVSKAELLSVCMATEGLYEDGDENEDGLLSFDELWRVVEKHWGQLDDDDDSNSGGMSKEEVRRTFDAIDKDGSGAISLSEFGQRMREARRKEAPII